MLPYIPELITTSHVFSLLSMKINACFLFSKDILTDYRLSLLKKKADSN